VIGYLERRIAEVRPEGPSAGMRDTSELGGVAISTFGKVIRRGWDWLGLSPGTRGNICGTIEAPDLAACLTLSKSDFVRTGARGATYLTYRKAIQEVVSRQLAAWGDGRDAEARPRTARLERDLERVLEGLADEFPLLRSLVDRRAGGQKRLPMPGRGEQRVPAPLFATVDSGSEDLNRTSASPTSEHPAPAEPETEPAVPPHTAGREPPTTPPSFDPPSPETYAAHGSGGDAQVGIPSAATSATVSGRRRPARYGLLVQFESRSEDLELARLVDSTIWINDAHPAYARAAASRSLGYHTAIAVGLALAPLAVEPHQEHSFVTQFLASWGAAQTAGRPAGRRRGGRG
jgi:hypothetical protein